MKYIKYLALALVIFATACKEAEKPVTKEQAAQFADALSKSVAKKDIAYVNDAFDVNMLVARIKESVPNKPADYWRDLKEGISKKLDFGEKIIVALGDKGRYNLVKQYEKDGKQHLLFRLYANYAINYHDFELANKGGKPKIADVYIYAVGDYFSATMGNIFTEMTNASNDVSMNKLERLSKLNTYMQEGKYQKAKALIDDLPVAVQSIKAIQLHNIKICSQISDSLHKDAVDKFQRDFPGDPSLDLILVDAYFIQKKYREALECVERLDKRINTDPMLDYYRGLLYNLQGKVAEAQQTLERLYKNLPDFSPGAIELTTYYMDNNEYEKAASIINKTKQNRDYDEAHVQNLCLLYPKLKQYLKE